MDKVFTEQPILDAGIRSVNFFNGRLLTAEDLTAEQTANLQANRLLGQALGDGIAQGFSVDIQGKPEDFSLLVDAGLAVNRRGDVLQLPEQTVVSLTGSLKASGDQVASAFSDCDATPSGQFTPTGLYVLTISPASGGEGRAPTSGLGNSVAACNTRYIVQGVTFHLVRISTPAITDQLRNILAYQSFGFLPVTGALLSASSPLTSGLETPFGLPPAGYGLLDGLSPDKYPICHVPLALIFTTTTGISFVDSWSVRRRLTAQTPTQPWQVYRSPRRASEMEAIFLQFQEHLADLVQAKELTTTFAANKRFKLLPPVGLLPGLSGGCDWRTFLTVHAPAYETRLDSGLLTATLAEAMSCSPFVVEDTARPPVALDVFTIPVRSGSLVQAIDDAMAGQLDQVSRASLLDLLDINDPNASFVLFARSRRGRIRLFFTSHPFEDSKAFFDAASTESNLEVRASPTPSGDFIYPNLEQGYYLSKGSIQGYKPIPTSVVEVVAGQVTRLQVTPVALTLELCFTSDSILLNDNVIENVRFCLVSGTFDTAIELSGKAPWLDFSQLELKTTERNHLIGWREYFEGVYPGMGFANSDPQVFMSLELARKKLFTSPELPVAYVVFDTIGFPLTFLQDTNINRSPVPLNYLAQIEKQIGGGKVNATQVEFTPRLLKMLIDYGILTFDQLAGGWIDLVTEATEITGQKADLLILAAAKYLAKLDKLEAGFDVTK